MRVLRLLAAALLLGALGVLALYWTSAPVGPDWGSASAERLRPGPFRVASVERTLIDPTRPTPAHGRFRGASSRTLAATLWFPENAEGPHPLIVYSHGFMSMRSEASRYAADLASHGAVVIAADYPATSFRAPGGPNIADAPSQPRDVAFLIDTVTGWSETERPFRGTIDDSRIGAAGLSLGGLTTTLAAFHPTLRDPRVSAAVSIAGPSALFAPRFFATAPTPFLMIAGDADAIVDYAAHAAPLPGKLANGGALLTIAGGSHTGFSPMAAGLMRVLGNPDRLGCWALSHTLRLSPRENPFAALGGEEQGLSPERALPHPCERGAPARALAPGRQLMIATLALRAFFESTWEGDPERRAASARFLRETLAHDFSEVSYREIPPLPPSRTPELREAPYHPDVPRASAPAGAEAVAAPESEVSLPDVSPDLQPR